MSTIEIDLLEQLRNRGDLPSPKGVALAIMRLTDSGDVSLPELGRVIKTDPAFVGKLIKAANSLIGQTRRPVAAVQDALTVLGIKAIRSLALCFSLFSNYRQGACAGFDYGRFWSASIVRAATVQAYFLHKQLPQADEAYCFGLLSHVGELTLATLFPQQYTQILADSNGIDTALRVLESQGFSTTQLELTRALFAQWGLPAYFDEGLLISDNLYLNMGAKPAQCSVHLANALRLASSIEKICWSSLPNRLAQVPQLLNLCSSLEIKTEELVSICDAAIQDWVEWSNLLNLTTVQAPLFKDLLTTSKANNPGVEIPPVTNNETETSLGGLKVLVVGPDLARASHIQQMLSSLRHQVFVSVDGPGALDLGFEVQPQMIIVDWDLPRISGAEFTRILRQTRMGKWVYILLMVDLEDEARLADALACGVDDFISKPVNLRMLSARVQAGQRKLAIRNGDLAKT